MFLSVIGHGWSEPTLGNKLSFALLIVTLAGFIVAGTQLFKTANASDQTRKIAAKIQTRVLENDLFLAVVDLEKIREQIENAVKDQNTEDLSTFLVTYSRIAGTVVELAPNDGTDGARSVAKSLSRAIASAKRTKSSLPDVAVSELNKIMKRPLGLFIEVSGEVNRMMVRVKKKDVTDE